MTAFMAAIERLSVAFSSVVIAYGRSFLQHADLTTWRDDIITGGATFVDAELFPYRGPISHRPMTVGYVGRISAEKGILNLIEAFEEVARQLPSVRFVIAGDGPQAHLAKRLSHELGLTQVVQWTGWIDQSKLSTMYGELRLLVIPSATEGLPNALLEGMSSGTIVLATGVGAVPDVVSPGIHGFLLSNNSPGEIAREVLRVWNLSPSELDRIGENASSEVLNHYDLASAVKRYETILAAIT